MSQAQALLRLDFLRIRNWFGSFVATKIIVFLGFALVLGLIVAAEFFMARTFFMFTSTQEEFGRAVARYSINAALLLLFLVSIGSSIAVSMGSLYRSELMQFLLTTPIPAVKLFTIRLVNAMFSSMWLVILLLTPLLVAFGMSFSPGGDFILRSLVVLLLLIVSSHSLGGAITVLLVKKTGRLSRVSLMVVFAMVIAGSLLLVRFLFPPSFFRLYFAVDWPTFQRQLGQLPLLASSLPTNWLALTITDGWSMATLAAALGSAIVLGTTLYIGKRLFLESWKKAQEGRFLAGKQNPHGIVSSGYPSVFKGAAGVLLTNELLAVMRAPAEATYAAFLTGLTIVLLFMMRSVPALQNAAPALLPAVYSLSLAGVSYLFMTLAVRLVYPLIAKEKRSVWFIFSLPVKRETLLLSKAAFALVLTLPSIPLALIAGLFMQLTSGVLAAYICLLVISTATVSLIQLLLGTIAPNFSESRNLDAVSTSGSGLAAIALSLAYISLSGFAFFKVAIGETTALVSVVTMTMLSLVWLGLLSMLSRRALHRYNL